MQLKVKEQAELHGASKEFVDYVRGVMTLPNPKYRDALKYGRWAGHIPQNIELYTELPGGGIAFPRGWANKCLQILRKQGFKLRIEDYRRLQPAVDLEFQGQLRDYQEDAVAAMLKRDFGILDCPTGGGKTVMALAIIAARRQPALILVHTKELLFQWADRIQEFLGIVPGVIGAGWFTIEPVTVALVHTARKHLQDLPQHFGHLIVDECFPVGTKVETGKGQKEIQNIIPGDTVKGYDHDKGEIVFTEVKNVFCRRTKKLCKVNLEGGKSVVCTHNHPFYTDGQYIPAHQLRIGQEVWEIYDASFIRSESAYKAKEQGCNCTLCKLREVGQMQRKQTLEVVPGPGKGRESLLFATMRGSSKTQDLGAKRKDSFGIQQDCGQDEKNLRQPNEKTECCKIHDRNQSQERNISTSAFCKRGERDWTNKSSKDACGCIGMENGDGCSNSPPCPSGEKEVIPKREWFPNLLQGGYCKCSAKDSCGGRWCKPQWETKEDRSKESGLLKRIRVESITFNEQANRSGPSGERKDCLVYNIETSTGNYFAEGCLVHNCHRVPSSMFTHTVKHFDSKYMLGLSATAFWRDGLDPMLHLILGGRIHQVNPQLLKANGAVLAPEIVRRKTDFRYNYRDDYPKMLSALTQDPERNRQIAADVIKQAKTRAGTALVVSDRVAHCQALADLIQDAGLKVRVLTGQCSKDERESIVAQVQAGQVDVLISTLQLLGEGFDCPDLCSLFLATPIKFKGRLFQVVGRILRPDDGKLPRVFDYLDVMQPVLRAQAKSRERALEEVAA
jgi:superfamily II DNA or RNA helicase